MSLTFQNPDQFENDLRDALIDDAEDALYNGPNNLAFQLLQDAETNFQNYANAHDYDIEHIWQDAKVTDARRTARGASARIEWPPLTSLFEFGVSPHTIRGNPILHFFWAAKNRWVRTEEVNWGSETGGIPESRAIRNAINGFRAKLRGRGPGGRFV